MKCEVKPTSQLNISESLRSEIPTETRRVHCRRRRSASRIRRGRESDGCGMDDDALPKGRSPATPLLTWKVEGHGRGTKAKGKHPTPGTGSDVNGRGRRKGVRGRPAGIVSVRRLAAELWRLHPSESSASGPTKGLHHPVAYEALMGPFPRGRSNGEELVIGTRDHQLQTPSMFPHRAKGFCHNLESPVACLNPAMERATKWDPRCTKANDEIYHCYGRWRLPEDQSKPDTSIISVLQSELDLTRLRVYELLAEQKSSKKKMDQFLKKLGEEKAAWRSREHEKVRMVIEGLKEDLIRERKRRQRNELMNTKLVKELTDSKLSAKRLMQDYEKERKSRELLEEVCDELAKEITEEKAEIESMKNESMKIRGDLEEERKMLQMAEVWREERLQMKLVDAKLALEEKYSQLNKLQEQLEAFLRSKTAMGSRELKEAGLLNEAVSSMKIQEVNEFSYHPPASEDGFSAFGDVHSGETNDKEIETCFGHESNTACYSPLTPSSNIQAAGSEITELHGNYSQLYTMASDQNGSLEEDESVWESESQENERGSSNSLDGSDPSVHGHQQASNHLENGTRWGAPADDIVDPDAAVASYPEQSRRKSSSVSRIWSTFPGKLDYLKDFPSETTKGRVLDVALSPADRASGHGVVTPAIEEHWNSPDAVNPNISRTRKGWIHWPRGFQRNSLKDKLLEARVECQKVQLKQALKQKI